VVLREGDTLIAHASVVQRQLVHGELPIRTGYVEAVAVRSDRRRRGHGRAVMTEAERVIAVAYDLGALSTGLDDFYERSGWLRWLGPTFVLAPGGLTRTEEDDGGVLVVRTPTTPELDLEGPLACDWRSGDVW
jgi:aminoglycoside 2'-N-acetyltransferase I